MRINGFVTSISTVWSSFADGEQFERTLDDSAIRRISLPESFLCADACLRILDNVSHGHLYSYFNKSFD